MTSTRAGIVHQPQGKTTIEYLLLEEVRVKAWVVDVSCRVVLTQTFHNPSNETGRAKYLFPLPANAAVCAFELELGDGSVIVGEVKEKEDAALTFSRAVEQGKMAALVQKVTDDIFAISVGSIPATTRVVAHLTFVMDLLDEALRDHVRLQLPMHIAERYGTPPAAMHSASAADSDTRVRISVDVQTSDIIHGIRSPTHNIVLRRYQRSGRTSQRRMSAVWKSSEFLTSDFVITIHAEGLDQPRCFAEVLHAGSGEGSTIAMQLTLIPKFLTPKVSSQEYVFIIDRSGSMANAPIETAKQTLKMLLRLLPSAQTTFNIFSFGSNVTSLWQSSRALDPTSLKNAISHVASMSADYGGTEIPKALRSAFNSRGLDRPAAVFLLTDGQIHGNEGLDPWVVIDNTIQNSPPQAPVRLFVLGIGAGVSSHMCHRLARKGNGECLFAVSAEDIFEKCVRLLNAGRSKNIERINIDWGDASSPLGDLSSSITPNLPSGILALEPPSPVQQAPHSLTKIFSGIRFTTFAITSFKTVPPSVRLITKLEGVSDSQELIVGVTKVKPFRDTDVHSIAPVVHTLAARKLIMELDDGIGLLPTPAPDIALLVSENDLRRAGIIRLGLTYQLASKHTSFVAVQKGSERERNRGGAWARSRLQFGPTDLDERKSSSDAPTYLDSLINGMLCFITSIFGRFSNNPASATTSNTNVTFNSRRLSRPVFPSAYDESDSGTSETKSYRPRPTSRSPDRGSILSHNSTNTFSSLSSLEVSTSDSCSSCWASSPTFAPQFHHVTKRAPSPEFTRDTNAGPGANHNLNKPPPIPREVYDLCQQMDVEGSFTATSLLTRLVGDVILGKADELGIDKKVWTTVVVVAYVKMRVQGEPDLLDLLSEKAKEFVEASEWSRRGGARRFEEMVREAIGLMGPSSP